MKKIYIYNYRNRFIITVLLLPTFWNRNPKSEYVPKDANALQEMLIGKCLPPT